MAALPDDVVELVLRRREVYVLNRHEPNFDLSRWDCLGVFNTPAAAQRAAVDDALGRLDGFSFGLNFYDPAERFVKHRDGSWTDRWRYGLGVDVYTVEARALDVAGPPARTLHFNFDARLKARIEDQGLSSDETRRLLGAWRARPPYEELLGACFSEEEERYRPRGGAPVDREAWQARHGAARP